MQETITVAGSHLVAPYTLRLNRRLQEAAASIHVWVHMVDLHLEDPITRSFRMGIWELLKLSLRGHL